MSMLLFALLATGASADTLIHASANTDYVVPTGSPVKFSSLSESTQAHFSGRYRLSGRYHFGNVGATAETEDMSATDGLVLYFIPDRADRARLPHAAGRQVRELWFDNRDDFIRAAVPPELARKVRATTGYSVSGRVSMRVEGYSAVVECDYASYTVHFTALVGDAMKVTTDQPPSDRYGC